MLLSLAIIFLFSLILAYLFQKSKLPNIIAYLIVGLVTGPFVLNLIDGKVLNISTELRQMALIIILLRVGFTLDLKDLKQVGRPAILLSFLPASFEIIAYTIFAPIFFNISSLDAAIMGAIISAVSPAVVVPRMLKLIEEKVACKKSIPQLILAGASCDDIYVLIIFSSFLAMAVGGKFKMSNLLNVPISITTGLIIGSILGLILSYYFLYIHKKSSIRDSVKVVIILSFAFLLTYIESSLKNIVAISSLLAIVAMASVLRIKAYPSLAINLSKKLSKLWIVAEIVLFVMVGTAVDIRYTLDAGLQAIILIFVALIFRSLAVYLSVLGTGLSAKEKLFCIIAYIPKATVQAAISSIPLSMGLGSGKLILSVAVMSIIITAPLGAIGIDNTYKKLLTRD